MAANNPRGLVPARSLVGGSRFRTNRYQVSANNPICLMIGDPVILHSDGKVRRASADASLASRGLLGVVARVYDSNGRPKTHAMPSNSQYIDGSTAGFVDVYDDPDVTFLATCDVTARQGNVGQFVRVTAGSANTTVGISGIKISLSATAATAAGQQFQIVGVGANERINDSNGNFAGAYAQHQDLEVRISDHHYRRSLIRNGVFASGAAIG